MSNIFSTKGEVVRDIITKQIELDTKAYFSDKEYIDYGKGYISLTRLDYSKVIKSIIYQNKFPGQSVVGFMNNLITEVSGITIYENIIYENDCIGKGRAINNFNERSDLYIFTLPSFFVSGATKIMTGTTTASTGVYIVDTLSAITFTTLFSADTNFDTYFVNDNGLKFDLYQRGDSIFASPNNFNTGLPTFATFSSPSFSPNIVSGSKFFTKTDFKNYGTSYSSITYSYDLTGFEGEFIIKSLFNWTNFTYFGKIAGLGHSQGSREGAIQYYLYNPETDYYFIYLKKAEKPKIFSYLQPSSGVPLFVFNVIPSFNGQEQFPIPTINTLSNKGTIVAVNGLVLSNTEYDYTGTTLILMGGTILTSDTITIVSSNQLSTPPIYSESYKITYIPNTTYPSAGQKIIYNTNSGKYEYWLDYEPTNQPVITVNGQVLSNEIDFYVSISDKKRIIFEGTLIVNDIITAFYDSIMKGANFVYSNNYVLNWTIPNPTKNNIGFFLVELTNYGDSNFNSPIFSGITYYITNTSNYEINLSFSGGTYNQKYLARVTNYKNYYTVLNELIQSTNVSDTITLTIGTNALNNY
jgi:hypothetical protein